MLVLWGVGTIQNGQFCMILCLFLPRQQQRHAPEQMAALGAAFAGAGQGAPLPLRLFLRVGPADLL